MPTLTQLKSLIAVDKLRHFGRAAESLGITQPSLSTQIANMEEELDLILLDRSKKPVVPTQVGEKIIAQAKTVLREHQRLEEMAQVKGELSGQFKLAIIPTLTPYLLPLFLEQFCKQFPKVDLMVEEAKTHEIVEKLHHDTLDAGLLATPLGGQGLIERNLFQEPFCLFVSPHHPLVKRKNIRSQELTEWGIWLLREGHCFRNQALAICQSSHRTQVFKNAHFAGDGLETLINLVRSRMGATLLPELAVATLPSHERANQVKKFQRPIPARQIGLVHSRAFLKGPIIQAVQEVILNCLPTPLLKPRPESLVALPID